MGAAEHWRSLIILSIAWKPSYTRVLVVSHKFRTPLSWRILVMSVKSLMSASIVSGMSYLYFIIAPPCHRLAFFELRVASMPTNSGLEFEPNLAKSALIPVPSAGLDGSSGWSKSAVTCLHPNLAFGVVKAYVVKNKLRSCVSQMWSILTRRPRLPPREYFIPTISEVVLKPQVGASQDLGACTGTAQYKAVSRRFASCPEAVAVLPPIMVPIVG